MTFNFPTEQRVEGRVRFLAPKLEAFTEHPWEYAPSKAPVFYNPVMEFNRDLAVLALQTYRMNVEGALRVCEPLAGCGVRGIRFAREVEGVEEVILNDINPTAFKMIQYNVELNNLSNVKVFNEDANLLLNRYASPRRRFDYIDVDPFGTPVTFMDSAVRALKDGGLIALTATDMAPLCGVFPNVALRKYGGRSIRAEYHNEVAIRLLIGSLASTAAKHNIGVNVLFSYGVDHYVRVYAEIMYGARRADESLNMMGYILHCFNCFNRRSEFGIIPEMSRTCERCGSRMDVAGPLWLGRIFDREFCISMRENMYRLSLRGERRIRKLLDVIQEEIDDSVTYFVIDRVSDRFNLAPPPVRDVVERLRRMGFKSSGTYLNPKGIRTNAPAWTLIEVVRELSQRRG